MFCNLVRSLQIFLCKLFCNEIFVAKIFFYRNLACFVFLAFYYNFLFNIFFYKCAQMCANVCKNVCQFLRICAKLFLQIIWHGFILQCSPFLFTGFSCYCGIVLPILETLRFIFLKGLWN